MSVFSLSAQPSFQCFPFLHGVPVCLSYSELIYEERLALWGVRHLFGNPVVTTRGQCVLRSFFGSSIDPVLDLARRIFLEGLHLPETVCCNHEELELLCIMERLQTDDYVRLQGTKRDVTLAYFSAVLAGQGYWLPRRFSDIGQRRGDLAFSSEIKQDSHLMLDDNFLQAAE